MPLLSDRFQPEAVLASPAPEEHALPRRLLYATSAGIGGTGLDSTSLEGALASHQAGFLRRATGFGMSTTAIPKRLVSSLNWHPVRLLSWLPSGEYYAAKKRYVDATAALRLRFGDHDAFHGWSGDCFQTLVEARLKSLPTVIDIPTWHRNKGAAKRGETRSEREARLANRGWRDWRNNLLIDRVRMLAEYELADVILVPSRKAAETFLAAGIPENKLHYVARGVDPDRYAPGEPPGDVFRLIFVGALIKRKGVHHLLAAWRKLNLKNAELVLVGSLHEEMKPFMKELSTENVIHMGFSSRVQDELRRATAFGRG